MLLTGPDLQCVGSVAVEDFCKIFLPNIGENQKKKSYHLRAGTLALRHMVNPPLVIALGS